MPLFSSCLWLCWMRSVFYINLSWLLLLFVHLWIYIYNDVCINMNNSVTLFLLVLILSQCARQLHCICCFGTVSYTQCFISLYYKIYILPFRSKTISLGMVIIWCLKSRIRQKCDWAIKMDNIINIINKYCLYVIV